MYAELQGIGFPTCRICQVDIGKPSRWQRRVLSYLPEVSALTRVHFVPQFLWDPTVQ